MGPDGTLWYLDEDKYPKTSGANNFDCSKVEYKLKNTPDQKYVVKHHLVVGDCDAQE